jgi:hypothetical protein
MTIILDTSASLAFLTGGINFFSASMDDPQQAGSAATLFSAFLHLGLSMAHASSLSPASSP